VVRLTPALADAVIWHDVECGGYEADLGLWRELAATADGPVLELGCGTGRVALDLAARGIDVTALDSDPALIRALDERARRQGEALETAVADARTFSLRRRGFALAIAAMQVTQLMDGRDGRAAMLSRVREHLGPGGVLAAALLPRLRTRVTADTLVIAAAITDAAVIAAVGTAHSVTMLLPVMVLGGFAQMTVMSSLNIAAQQVLPGWVRGRGLAVFMLVFQLGIAGGAAVWGLVAGRFGLTVALYGAAVVMALSSLLAPFFRLNPADHLDVRPAYHTEPHGEVPVDPTDGPVMVTVEYDIGAVDASAFTAAARRLRQVRRRAGAVHWAVFEDVERPGTTLETYVVTSWTEHKRQADRRTARDQQVLDEVESLHRTNGRPRERYLLGLHFRRQPPTT